MPHVLRRAFFVGLTGLAVLSGCAPSYAPRCESIALGAPISSLPATATSSSGDSAYGRFLAKDPSWFTSCWPPVAATDGGLSTLAPGCGEHFAVGGEYVGEDCLETHGIVAYCGAYARDGVVVATRAYCQD
jgi:hypothetical protein